MRRPNTRRRLPLNSLRVFEVVARHGTFRAAAKELYITPAAVGQQVRLLEAHVGGALLVRKSDGGYLLTEAARAGAIELQTAFQQLARAAAVLGSSTRRTVTVTTSPSFAASWLVARLGDFQKAHPDIELLLHSSEEIVDLDTRGADVAIRFSHRPQKDYDSRQLFAGDLFPVCSPQLLASAGPVEVAADLLEFPLLHVDWSPRKGSWPDWSSWFKSAGVADVRPRKRLHFTDHSQAIQAAVAGHGVTLAMTPLALDHLQAGRLVKVMEPMALPTEFAYYVVTTKDRVRDPDVAAFKAWILSQATGTRAGERMSLRRDQR